MNETVEKTIRVLSSSKGKAASRALHIAVSSSEPKISLLASRVVLVSNNTGGMFELIKHFDSLTPEQLNLLASNVEKLGPSIRTALLNDSPVAQDNAIAVIKKLRPYTVIPLLLRHLELGGPPRHLGIVQWAITYLVDYLSQEFRGTVPRRPSYAYTLLDISDALDHGFAFWRRHERALFIDIYFQLCERFNGLSNELSKLLSDPNHPAHSVFDRKLADSQVPQIMRFLVRQLESPQTPQSLLSIAARRKDRVFVRMLLETVGYSPLGALRENLSRIRRFEWLSEIRYQLGEFDPGCHRFLVELVRSSGLTELEKTIVYETVLRQGSQQGQMAVIERLRQMPTPDGDRLVLLASESEHPDIQAAALSQLRPRNIPGASGRLLRYVDSPHPEVRKVLSEELIEFRMDRLLQSLNVLSDEQRNYMLRVIDKIDPQKEETVARELQNAAQPHKDFLLSLIQEERKVVTYETPLMVLIKREHDPALRLHAVKLLAFGVTEISRRFLRSVAVHDTDKGVRVMAQRIYEIRNMLLERNA
ncbi:MAG: hypothetical protein FWD31_00430 [Planctomycetaceae bacterium]|nr:hypothetical protein [Planctomycetaceae bacterium]